MPRGHRQTIQQGGLQAGIFIRNALIGSQVIPKQDQLRPLFAGFFDHVNMVCTRLALREIVSAGYAILALERISQRGERRDAHSGLLEVPCRNRDIEDRLGRHTDDRGAAYVLDIDDMIPDC